MLALASVLCFQHNNIVVHTLKLSIEQLYILMMVSEEPLVEVQLVCNLLFKPVSVLVCGAIRSMDKPVCN